MVYYITAGIAAASIVLFALGLIFRGKMLYFLVGGIICAGVLSFYIFYYVSSYSSNTEEVTVDRSLKKLDEGRYILDMHIIWNKKPEIFGFDGDDDLLVLRYNSKEAEILSSNMPISESQVGKTTIKLSKTFKYSQIEKNEREAFFRLKDGDSSDITVTFKIMRDNVPVKIFYLHDFDTPLEGTTYWEKYEELNL